MSDKSNIRHPAVAGMFYPAKPAELREMIHEYLDAAPSGQTIPKAIIAPHAGYVYSGPIAASVYKLIAPARGIIKRVILLGPSHRVPFFGLAVPTVDSFETPLGRVPVDKDGVSEALKFEQVQKSNPAHTLEHSLEVQLPFLQEVLGEFKLVPFTVGDASPKQIAEVIEALWGGPETLIVISSDLSHYQDYKSAQKLDKATSNAIVELQPDDIEYEQACGRLPICGLLEVIKKKGMHGRIVDLRNSGDTAGPRDQVVGYGAYAFE